MHTETITSEYSAKFVARLKDAQLLKLVEANWNIVEAASEADGVALAEMHDDPNFGEAVDVAKNTIEQANASYQALLFEMMDRGLSLN